MPENLQKHLIEVNYPFYNGVMCQPMMAVWDERSKGCTLSPGGLEEELERHWLLGREQQGQDGKSQTALYYQGKLSFLYHS